MQYSVLIPCYQMEDTLIPLVDYLLQEPGTFAEIIVLLDGSPCPPQLEDRKGVRLVRLDKNQGLSHARNTLLKEARHNRVLFLDADVLPLDGFLDALLRVESSQVFVGQEADGPRNNIWQTWRLLFFRQTQGAKAGTTEYVSGLCFGGDRDTLRTIGFSQEFRNYGEDVDFGLRASDLGIIISYEPGLGVLHQRHDDFLGFARMMAHHIRYQTKAFYRNNRSPLPLLKGSLRLLYISIGSSLIRHKSIRLALASLVASTYGIYLRVKAILCKDF